MTLTTEEIVNIVVDDEKYLQHVNAHSLPQNEELRVFQIPKSSFTGFRLSYASPVELSLSSKVVLLGGIPSHWYKTQRDSIMQKFRKTKTSKAQGSVNQLKRYGLKAIYDPGSFLEKRLSGKFFGDGVYRHDVNFMGNSNESHQDSENACTAFVDNNGQSNKSRQMLPSSPTLDFHQNSSRSNKDKQKIFGKSSDDLPMVSSHYKGTHRRFLTQLDDEGNKDKRDEVSHGRKQDQNCSSANVVDRQKRNETVGRKSTNKLQKPSNIISSEENIWISKQDEQQLVDHLYREQKQNEIKMNRLLNGVASSQNQESCSTDTYISAASDLKEATRLQERDRKSNSPTVSSSGTSTLSVIGEPMPFCPLNGIDSMEQNNSNYKFDRWFSQQNERIDDTLDGLKNAQGSRKSATASMKRKSLSKNYKRLSFVPPKPEVVSFDQSSEPVETDKNVNHKVHKYNLESFNDKREGIRTRLRQRFSRKVGSYSSYVHPDRTGPIVLMDKALVLVKNAVSQRNPISDFSEAEPIDTRVAYRWQEYLVVARLTKRRDHPVLIQFCHHKHFSHFHSNTCHCDEHNDDPGSGNTLDFYLNKNCFVGIYSILDKTLFIEKPDDKLDDHTLEELYDLKDSSLSTLRFYILRCRTCASTSRWYDFLQNVVGGPTMHNILSLKVPEANVSFTLHLSKNVLELLTEAEMCESQNLKIAYIPRGYRVFQIPILRFILVAVNERLKETGYDNLVKNWEGANVNLGCDFRHYDLINWCPEHRGNPLESMSALFQSHILEFRPYTYYGRALVLQDGSTLIEPSPIEGFLLRLTNYKGSDKGMFGKPYMKPAYFFTSENFLFRMKSTTSTPPVPLDLLMYADNQLNAEKVRLNLDDLPDVYEQNPYPLDLESHIEWLKDNLSDDLFVFKDYYAFKCFSRRIVQILKSESLVDMTEIEDVYQGAEADSKTYEINYQIYNHARSVFWKTNKSLNETERSIIFLRIKDGRIIKLLASNPIVSGEWVSRLKALVSYWKEKQTSDLKKLWDTKVQNIDNLKIEEVEEANINGQTPKWVTERGVTDPSIYNVNALSVLRPILQRGVLYQKPKKHSVFSKYWVVLIPGFLILYHSFRRSKTGYAKSSIDHIHYMTIPIRECYVYSGTLTELDLLNRDRTFDEFNPGSHYLPRVYNDGWISSETETSRCFTLWFGKKRVLSRSSKNLQKDDNYGNDSPHIPDLKNEPSGSNTQNPNMLTMLGQLGVSGSSMVFMARSRQEKDLWVLALYYELERLKTVDD